MNFCYELLVCLEHESACRPLVGRLGVLLYLQEHDSIVYNLALLIRYTFKKGQEFLILSAEPHQSKRCQYIPEVRGRDTDCACFLGITSKSGRV